MYSSYREETQPLSGGHTDDRRTGSQSATLRQNSTPKRTLKDISLEPAVCILYSRVRCTHIYIHSTYTYM